MKLTDSQTQQNIKKAFMRESSAFVEYLLFGEKAKKEGYEQLYRIFTEIAGNEKAHAEMWLKLYHKIFDTEQNLLNSADLEKYEFSEMYSEFSKTAEQEGFLDIKELFDGVAEIEKAHRKRFLSLAKEVQQDSVFKKKKEVVWKCANCGHIIVGNEPPKKCPICSHPQSYFFVFNDN